MNQIYYASSRKCKFFLNYDRAKFFITDFQYFGLQYFFILGIFHDDQILLIHK